MEDIECDAYLVTPHLRTTASQDRNNRIDINPQYCGYIAENQYVCPASGPTADMVTGPESRRAFEWSYVCKLGPDGDDQSSPNEYNHPPSL